jgi:serine phosphatase RsbU (regulator of sigma subunit)
MSKAYFKKTVIFILFLGFFVSQLNAQNNFILKGQVMMNLIPVSNAKVLVYENSKFIDSTNTSTTGKFKITLKTQKKYTLAFTKKGMAKIRVLISTKLDRTKSNGITTKPVIMSLNSKKVGNTNFNSAFAINENGIFTEEIINYSNKVKEAEDKEKDKEEEIAEQKKDIEIITANSNPEDAEKLKIRYEQALAKIDSLLINSRQKADLMINTAKIKSSEIVADAYNKIPDKTESSSNKVIFTDNKIVLKEIGIKEKEFNERPDIKKHQEAIKKFESKANKTKKDSMLYLESMVSIKEAALAEAKKQLESELDSLNDRTEENSLELLAKQKLISRIQEEIEQAKGKIVLQQLEIQNKNLMLMIAIAGSLFFFTLFAVVYQNFRLKKKTNARLEAQNKEIAKKNKKIIDSITYAKTIQQAILPIKTGIDKYFESFIIFQPKDIVSGDFYWFTHFEETNTSIFAVIDCTGHGVPGAFMSMIGNRLLVEVVNESGITEPAKILENLDRNLRKALMQDETFNNDGMDMCICKIKPLPTGEREICFAGAKRPLFYTDKNEVNYIKGTVRGIGGRARLRKKQAKPFEKHSLKLNKGEYLYLTTDGFLDLQSPKRRKYGRKNFMDLLNTNMNKSIEEQHNSIVEALDIHKGNELQIDDITILGVKI